MDVEEEAGEGEGISRRQALAGAGGVAVAVLVSSPGSGLGDIAVPVKRGKPQFLDPARADALRGLVDVFIPADDVGGALAGGCAEAIDALLAAFQYKPPRIYAGGPFSDRGGAGRNDFKRFLRLDRYEERAWKLRIRGSRGRKALEFNGPVRGWQRIYTDGLAALNRTAGGSFGSLPGPARELQLRSSDDPDVAALVDVAFPHTLQFMYGAPEYGGNRDLLGWRYTNYDGDVHPRGYTDREITERETTTRRALSLGDLEAELESVLADAGSSVAGLLALAGLGAPDAAHGIVARSGDSLEAMQAEIRPIIEWASAGGLNRGA